MKRSILYFYAAALLTNAAAAFAQEKKPMISFEQESHDFGTIKEEGGPAIYDFKFTNSGGSPLIVSDAKASCGCTTPSWSKDPIAPGNSGYIKVSYDTKGRPGNFTKTITVTSNTEPAQKVLTIKGTVTPRPKTSADYYPSKVGNLRFTSNHMAFLNIKSNQVKQDTLKIFNEWNRPMTFSVQNVPAHLKMEVKPLLLDSGKEGLIIGTYDASLKKDFGFLMDRFELVTNDSLQGKKTINVSATVEEYFPPMTKKDSAEAPKISFNETSYNYGKIKQGDIVHHDFAFTNKGKKDLLIRKTKASCGCTASQPDKTILKPGESSVIKVDFNSAGKHGKDSKTITVISNDPLSTTNTLTISGEIEVPAPPSAPDSTKKTPSSPPPGK